MRFKRLEEVLSYCVFPYDYLHILWVIFLTPWEQAIDVYVDMSSNN